MAVKGNKLTPRCREAEVAEKVRLGDVCSIVYGERIRKKDSVGGAYPVYGGGGETFRWPTFNRENKCVVSRFAMSKECVRFVSGKFFLNDSGLTVETKDGRSLLQYYLDWFLFGNQDKIYSLGQGAAQKNLEISRFINLKIPLPPLPAQRRIAAELDKICDLKKNAETRLEKLDHLVKSRFVEMFGDCPASTPIMAFGKVLTGSTPSMKEESYYRKADFCFVKPSDLSYDVQKFSDSECHLSCSAEAVARMFNPGAVLVTCIGATIGKMGIAKVRGSCNQQINFIEPYDNIDSSYLAYAIQSRHKELVAIANSTAVPIINKSEFSRFRLPLPPLALQREFAAFVAKVDKLRLNVRETVAKMDMLYRSKLQEYFG